MSISLVLWAVLGGVSSASGQGERLVISPPRLTQLFDFEGTDAQGHKLGLGHALPRYWYAIGRDPLVNDRFFLSLPLHEELIRRAGYPTYGTVHFDSEHTTSGDFSLRLAVDGGNAGAFLEFGALAAVPGSTYRITAKVRTQDLHGASARLCAYFFDATGQRIDASVSCSELIRTRGQWADISVSLQDNFSRAAWIGLEADLLQPQPQPGHPLAKQQLIFQDVEGQAWFDDIAVWQLPRVQVSTPSRLNLHKGDASPTFNLSLRDLTGRQMTATVVVYDHALREVDRTVRQVGAGAPTRWNWQPDLPGFGWYLADLRVSEGRGDVRQLVARTFGAVLWIADEGPIAGGDAKRFTLVAEDLPQAQLQMIPSLLETTGLESVVLSIWDQQTTLATVKNREAMLDRLLSEVVSAGRTVTLSLHPVPTALAQLEDVAAANALGVLQADAKYWLAYLRPMLRHHGQRVRRWQLGSAKLADAFYYDDPASLLQTIREQFEELAPRPQLIVPWRMDQSRRNELGENLAFAMDVGPGVSADAMQSYLAEWLDSSASMNSPARVALYLREAPANRQAPQSRIDSLALRMVRGWQHQANALAITRPWTKAAERREAIVPDPLLGVFINVARRLAGRRVVADHLPIGEGLATVVLDGPAGGLLVAWSRSAAPQNTTLRMVLGDRPVAIDVWGNRTPVPLIDGKHELPLRSTPTFIEGIDPFLALLRAGFQVNQPFIESTQQPHRRTIKLTNPYPTTISGRLIITGPSPWNISPLRHIFSLASGQTAELPVVMSFPLAEIAGPKRLTAHIEFDTDRHYSADLFAPMELGLEDIAFDAAVTMEPGPNGRTDAMVAAVITNNGQTPRSLYLFAILPEHPREERLIAELQPGQSIIRRLRFNDVKRGARLRAGVRETNGPTMLNHMLQLGEDGF